VAFNVLMARLAKQNWNVYAKRPYKEAWHALAYYVAPGIMWSWPWKAPPALAIPSSCST
jgi:hypothetical protein